MARFFKKDVRENFLGAKQSLETFFVVGLCFQFRKLVHLFNFHRFTKRNKLQANNLKTMSLISSSKGRCYHFKETLNKGMQNYYILQSRMC